MSNIEAEPRIERVRKSWACPRCGERQPDQLTHDDEGATVTCKKCKTRYAAPQPPAPSWQSSENPDPVI